jgi:hypothetical protein
MLLRTKTSKTAIRNILSICGRLQRNERSKKQRFILFEKIVFGHD